MYKLVNEMNYLNSEKPCIKFFGITRKKGFV